MKRTLSSLVGLLGLVGLVGCASTPQSPASLRSLDAAAGGTTFQQLARTAPTEMAGVASDRARAHAATREGDTITAELFADRALARFQLAKLITERALIAARQRDAEPRLTRSEQELRDLGQEQSMRDTRIRELELRAKTEGDMEPKTARTPAENAARQRARLEVAKSFAAEATLLCGAAKLLGADAKGEAAKSIDDAAAQIPKAPDFDKAVAARLGCLSVLETTRRATSVGGASDAMLQRTSEIGRFTVKRDERGVVVTLPASPEAADLQTLGRAARGHSVQVVVHDAVAGSTTAKTRGDSIVKALVEAGADRTHLALELPGAALPVGDPAVPSLRAANERVELVYVQ